MNRWMDENADDAHEDDTSAQTMSAHIFLIWDQNVQPNNTISIAVQIHSLYMVI